MTAERLVIGVALSARSWRGDLQRRCRDHEPDLAVVLLHQGAEALAGELDVLVVDDDTSWVSVPFVKAAREAGVAMIGMFDPAESDGFGRRQLEHHGIDTVLDCSVDSDTLVDAIRGLRRDPDLDGRFVGLLADAGLVVNEPSVRRIVAVGGPAGAGATEVAIALAAGSSHGRPLIVDVDETHPTLARRLGLGLHPHLLTAVDAHRHEPISLEDVERRELRDCVANVLGEPPYTLPFDVFAGLVTRDDWALVRPDDVVDLIEACADEWPAVIVRLGPTLEDLQRHVGRYELSRRSASTADHLVGVCDASASGILRFVDWLVDALGLIGDQPVDVVCNRAPRSAAQRAQLVDQLRSVAGDRIGTIVCAPTDRRVSRASWDGTIPPHGPFRRAVDSLGVFGETPEPRSWRRAVRLGGRGPTTSDPSASDPTEPESSDDLGLAHDLGARR